MLTGSSRRSTGPAKMPPPRPPSPIIDASASEEESDDGPGMPQPYKTLNAVRMTPERREAIRAIVPALDFDRLKKPYQAKPPAAKPVADESKAWPTLFGDVKPKSSAASGPPYPPAPTVPAPVPPTGLPKHSQSSQPAPSHLPTQLASVQAGSLQSSSVAPNYVSSSSFQSQLRAAEREAKRKGGVDTLDFLSKLELVEALEGGITPAPDTSGSAPPHYKGSPMRNHSPLRSKAGFLDDAQLPISAMLEKPPPKTAASKPKKPKKPKKAGGKEGSAKAKAALKAKPLVSSGFANLVSGRW